MLELSEELHRFDYGVMALQETWLKPSTPSRLVCLPGYQLHRADRPDGRGYGGVAVAIKDGIESVRLKIPERPRPDSALESLWVLVNLDNGKQVILGNLYRPPNHTVSSLDSDFNELESQLQRVTIEHPNTDVVLSGDLNCDTRKPVTDPAHRRLSQFLFDYELHQCVLSPTFVSGSIIDVLLVKNRNSVHRCGTRHCHFSPHKFVRAFLTTRRPRFKPVTIQTRSLRTLDLLSFHSDLCSVNWTDVYTAPSVSEQWAAFLRHFLPILDLHTPVKTLTIRNPSAPPVTQSTKDLMARRRGALREWGHGSTEYRDLNRAVRSAIRCDVRNDVCQRIAEQGPTSLWRNVRGLVDGKSSGPRTLPSVTADRMNEYFVQVGPRVAAEVAGQGPVPDLSCRLPRVGACAFTVSPVSLDALRRTVFSMRNTSACGPDGLCIRVIKASFDAIGDILLHMINTCLVLADFPDPWKHSIVHPIFKSGDTSDPSNFRPISIVPVLAKIVERVVQRQLYYYLSSNHLLSPTQHGFRPHHSTETALVSVTDRIMSAADRGEVTLLCLIDLSKCFDVIEHSILLTKIQQYGVDTKWFASYLSGHMQTVSFTDSLGKRHTSKSLPNNIGVFQGSSLGPLLYNIFSNDLSLFANEADVFQYADDTQVIVSGKKSDIQNLITNMELALASLDGWFRANSLKVNPNKTQLMIFGTRQNLKGLPKVTVKFRGVALEPCTQVKNLGVIFDSTLSWEQHISVVTRRCFGTLTGLAHLRHYLPHSVLTALVSALALSHVRYCLAVYGNGSAKNCDRIQKILNFAARVISGKRKFDHISDVRERLEWLSAPDLVRYHTLTLAHRVMRWGEPDSLSCVFRPNSEVRDRRTRQDDLLHVPRCTTAFGQRRFAVRAPAQYNALPHSVSARSVSSFGPALKRHMLENG